MKMDDEEILSDIICPSCKGNGTFIFDENELIYLGYSKDQNLAKSSNLIFVEIGICTGACTFEIIIEDGDEIPKYNSTGTELIVDDYSESGLIVTETKPSDNEVEFYPPELKGSSITIEKMWEVQSEFASSVNSELQFLDPPFHVPRKAIVKMIPKVGIGITEEMLKDEFTATKIKEDNESDTGYSWNKEQTEKPTSIQNPNSWISQLCGVLLELKRSRTKVKGSLNSDNLEKELEINNETMAQHIEMKDSGYPGLDESQIELRVDAVEDLENLIGELKLKMNSNNRVPIVKMELIFCAFMHKTTAMENVEPWWVYLKRLKINNRSIENTLRNWHPAENIPSFNKKVKDLLKVNPTKNTIKSFHSMIRAFCHTVDISGQEFDDLLQVSLEIFDILESTKWGDSDESIADILFKYGYFKLEKLDFGIDDNVHAPGFVEAICIEQAAKKTLSKIKARELSETYLFPNPTDPDTWWKNSLSNEAILQFKNRESTMEYLELSK